MLIEYKFLREIDCKQGAVRAVRFTGMYLGIFNIHLIIFIDLISTFLFKNVIYLNMVIF